MKKDLKKCSKCGKIKELDEFRKCNKNKGGLHNYCASCHSEDSREKYNNNKTRRLKQIKKWQAENKERIKGYRINKK